MSAKEGHGFFRISNSADVIDKLLCSRLSPGEGRESFAHETLLFEDCSSCAICAGDCDVVAHRS